MLSSVVNEMNPLNRNTLAYIAVAPVSEKELLYSEALLYCSFCNHGGYTDWRLATKNEYFGDRRVIGWYDENPWNTHISKTIDRRHFTPVRTI